MHTKKQDDIGQIERDQCGTDINNNIFSAREQASLHVVYNTVRQHTTSVANVQQWVQIYNLSN